MKTRTLVLMLVAFSLSLRAGAVSAQSSRDAVGEGLGFKGIAAGGLVDPEHLGSTFGDMGRLDPGTILPGLRLLPTVEYWSKTNKAAGNRGAGWDHDSPEGLDRVVR